MKRYTLKFNQLDGLVSTDSLKEQVEQVLFRLHPRITYKFRRVIPAVDGMMLAEFAVDGKRKLIEDAFLNNEWKLPVRLESLGWGWEAKRDEETLAEPGYSAFGADPLATTSPKVGLGEFQLNKRRLWLRYIVLMVSTLFMVLLLVANYVYKYSPALEGIYRAGFIVWLLILNETPFDIQVYADKVSCNQEGFEVKYWLKKQPSWFGWEQIWGMDFSEPICVVFGDERKIRILISERFGCKEQKLLLKTIVNRASLNYVGGNFRTMIYRRYDARDS